MSRRRTNGVVRRGGGWSVVLDVGDQLYRQCPACRKRYWSRDSIPETCTRDGALLGQERSGRRQEWHSGFRTRSEAEAERDRLRTRLRENTFVSRSRITVGEYFDQWLPSIRARVRPTTWANYRVNYEAYIRPGIGDVKLQALSPLALDALYAELLDGAGWRGGRPLSVKSVRNIHALLSKVLGDAFDQGKIARNVARQAKPPTLTKVEMNIWTKEQMNAFLSSVASDRLFALWRLACRTGMRRGELAGLRWIDVDFERGELSVRQSLVIVDANACFQPPKTERGRRKIALDDTTLRVLRTHHRHQVEEQLAWGEDWQDSGLVFCREDGSQIYPDLISQWFTKAAQEAGLPTIPFHGVRHSYATSALEAGMPVMILSGRLGHSSPALTLNVYSHALPATDQAEATRVAAELD